MRNTVSAITILCVLVVGVTHAEEKVHRAPEMTVERTDDGERLWIDVFASDGGPYRQMLRHSDGRIYPGTSGWDPSGRVCFAVWEENDARWFSYSRDSGQTWSTARPLKPDLRLRDAGVYPRHRMPGVPGILALPEDRELYLVQFKTVSLPEWREAVERVGAVILAYFPHNGHLVRLAREVPDTRERLERLEFVERVEPYHPWYRLSTDLRDWLEAAVDDSPERVRVRVMAAEWGPEAKERIVTTGLDLGAEIVALWPSGHVLEVAVNRDQLMQLAAHDDVQWIDLWSSPIESMDAGNAESGAARLEESLGYCGEGVRGEVMDSGIDLDHRDFGEKVLVHGIRPGEDDHGTATYGILFGQGLSDDEAMGYLSCGQGIFADSHFVADRFAHTLELKTAPYFASFQSNSWSTKLSTGYDGCAHEIDDIIWRLDIAVTQAQGNYASRLSSCQAWAKNIISVGAIWNLGTQDEADDTWRPDPSGTAASTGPAEDGRVKPDLSYWYDGVATTSMDDGRTSSFAGTSAATAEVSGVLGLVVQMWSDNVWGTDPVGSTPFERMPRFSTLKALLINSTFQYPFRGEHHDLSRFRQGWGRPSPRIAAERASTSFIVDQDTRLELGQIVTYSLEVEEGQSDLRITMTYPDPPGNPASLIHRVNDLDLRVISPSRIVYHGNAGLTEGNESLPGGLPNSVDTVENVFVIRPEPGIWDVEIDAVEINQDAFLDTADATDAVFSLVVTGARQAAAAGSVQR